MHYRNFKIAVYIPAWVALSFTKESLAAEYDFIERFIGLDKVYLETHRSDLDVGKDQLLMIKEYLEEKGVEVAGGITTTTPDFEGAEPGKNRLFDTFCYTEQAMRDKIRGIAEYTAGIFDEVILDDFYFTNCMCESCIRAKGDRDWVSFRRELMRDVSENLIVGPAKAVNPKVKMVVKYPNWRESYHFTGYLPDAQQDIFDATYIGTETRSPAYADQHLPEYLSYSLVRYIENAWPGICGCGWFDTYQCWSADRYLEQAYLTAFAGADELALFQWGDLIGNYYVGGMGIQLGKIDAMLDGIGKPTGTAVYLPYASSGENHLEMRLGMLGIPMEPTPVFPKDEKLVLLTESAAADEDIAGRLKAYVAAGGDAVITTGFLRQAGEKIRKAGLTEAVVTDRKIAATRYQVTYDDAGYIEHCRPVLFPEILHGNNASWSLLNGGDGDYHTSLILRSCYGKGRLFIISIPDNSADLYRLPVRVTDEMKRILCPQQPVSGDGFSMFTYDDGSMILYRYVKPDLHPARVRIYTREDVKVLRDTVSGETFPVESAAGGLRGVFAAELSMSEEKPNYGYAQVILQPGVFRKFRWE
ncbi:MAG: hypothetical protein IK078_07995 [Lachnospiraceae bacterium]|nr:hypothetical protein [Lachnospiraceae bacterium]